MNSRKRQKMSKVTRAALFAALICVTSFIQIPVGAIPVTFQLFGIYLSLFTLGGLGGTVAVALYLAIGAVGLPVFSGYSGGIGKFFEASGGFLFGFLVLALVYTALSALLPKGKRLSRVLPTAISLVALYATGIIFYLALYLDFSLASVLSLGVSLIFLFISDLVKIFLAYLVYERIKIKL